MHTNVRRTKTLNGKSAMQQDTGYYVIRKQAVPEVLLKVVEAKKLLESGKVKTVNDGQKVLSKSEKEKLEAEKAEQEESK